MATNDSIDSANIPPPLSHGGTGANLTASNGGILYSDATKAQILAATSTGNQPLLSGASGAPGWSTATYPGSTTANQLLYSSANNTIAGLTSGNDGALITSGAGVPSISSTLPSAVITNIPGRLKSFQVFTSGTAATYTRPAGITAILVECIGGGAGGGGSAATVAQAACAGGGGSGGYARKYYSSAAASYTYTVGATANGGTAGNNPGTAGNNTTFDTITATGGGAGGGGVATANLGPFGAAGGGGLPTGGDINMQGGAGALGLYFGVATGAGGKGGDSVFGGGAAGIASSAASVAGANAGTNTGGGGSGAASSGTVAAAAGGNGAAGLIVVWEFS
ncbi:MAG TPA: glycine-rich domain-containing protein [Candidatus Brocadiaceae bacterium]